MQKTAIPAYSFGLKSYYLLTKPGIMMGNAITAAGGFCLGLQGAFDFKLFLLAVMGLSCVIGSSCILNNYIDRVADQKMERTKRRALATGEISVHAALLFSLLLLFLGSTLLSLFTNALTVALALFGLFVYVALYSFSKYVSVHGTLIGSIAGAIPPVVGYTAASGRLDLGAFLLFSMIVLWQMPHFYAIAIYRSREYESAGIPVLPLKKGMKVTKIHMFCYTAVFVLVSTLLFAFGYSGVGYLAVALIFGLAWLYLSFQGFSCENDAVWAKKMFRLSLVVVTALSMAMILRI